jgi:ketosteroid isomerase-like protein
MSHGEIRAEEFLAALAFEDAWTSRDPDAVMGFFAEDAELVSSAPFPSRDTHRGEREIRRFVAEHLAGDVRVDLTKKQVSRNGVAWTVRLLAGDGSYDRSEGIAKAHFREGKIKTLRLGTGLG